MNRDKLKEFCTKSGISHRDMNAETLRVLRLSLKLTQAQMAEKLGIGWRMYAYVESGAKPLSTASTILAEQLLNEKG